MSARLPNTATSRATNVDWWRQSSIQPKLIQERQSVPQHFGVNNTFLFRILYYIKIYTYTVSQKRTPPSCFHKVIKYRLKTKGQPANPGLPGKWLLQEAQLLLGWPTVLPYSRRLCKSIHANRSSRFLVMLLTKS